MKRVLLLLFALVLSTSVMAASPTIEERLAENNFQIVDDLYQERPIWIKTYHCDSATILRTLMNNPQVIIEREFEGRLICRMCDVKLVRDYESRSDLPSYMLWAATLYFTVEIGAEEYTVELCEAVWNGVTTNVSDEAKTKSYTLYSTFYNQWGNIDKTFVRNKAANLNERLSWLFAPRLR